MELHHAAGVIRDWREGDAPALARIANNRRIWIRLAEGFPHPYSEADARAWIAHARALDPARHFALERDGELVGATGVVPGRPGSSSTAEIGYWIGEPYWGRGIATATVAALSGWAFEQLDLLRLEARVFEGNAASMRVLEKVGYQLEGRLRHGVVKDGAVLDVFIYGLTREDWGARGAQQHGAGGSRVER